jgi:hypothetical protein
LKAKRNQFGEPLVPLILRDANRRAVSAGVSLAGATSKSVVSATGVNSRVVATLAVNVKEKNPAAMNWFIIFDMSLLTKGWFRAEF